MKPTEILNHEHRVIEVVLDCLDSMANRCQQDGCLDGESAAEALDFFRSFADMCHHAKEEDQLFPLMESRGFSPHEGPTAVMRAEHVQGRQLIAAMDEAIPAAAMGNEAGRQCWIQAARGYSALLRDHITKEDHCLFPMAEQMLSADDQTELSRQFKKAEQEEIGPEVHDRCLKLAETLAERFGVETRNLHTV